MNYQKIYENIIEKAKFENRKKLIKTSSNWLYYEEHHIIPRCLNGNNDKQNKVLLTAKEHFVCHKLLTYIYSHNKSIYNAFYLMCSAGKYKYNVSSRDYAYARELFALTPISEKTRKKFSDIGKNRIFSKKTRKKIADAKKDILLTDIHKLKISEGLLEAYDSGKRIKPNHTGEKNPMYGKPGCNMNNLRKTCEYCKAKINPGNYGRWHGEKCKFKYT